MTAAEIRVRIDTLRKQSYSVERERKVNNLLYKLECLECRKKKVSHKWERISRTYSKPSKNKNK